MLNALYLINSGTTYCSSLAQEMRSPTANYADLNMKNKIGVNQPIKHSEICRICTIVIAQHLFVFLNSRSLINVLCCACANSDPPATLLLAA